MTATFYFPETTAINKRPRRLLAVLAEQFSKQPERWGQGKWGHKDAARDWSMNPPPHCRCLYTGACDVADGDKQIAARALQHFCRVHDISRANSALIERVAEWNDMPGRTVHDVIKALREAAATPVRRGSI